MAANVEEYLGDVVDTPSPEQRLLDKLVKSTSIQV